MKHPIARRVRLSGYAASALLVTSLAPPPAHAQPVFTMAHFYMSSDSYNSGTTACTTAADPPPMLDVPVAENGAPTTASSSVSGTITNNGDATDVTSFAVSSTNTGRVTSVGGNPGVVELTNAGSVQTATSAPAAACRVNAFSGGSLEFDFTVAQGGFMTFTIKGGRYAAGAVSLYSGTGDSYINVSGNGTRLSGTNRFYMPPGAYEGFLRAETFLISTPTPVASTPSSISIRGSFDVAGSQTEAVSGKGKRYLTFPATRSCATDSVDAAVTGKGRRAKQIRKIKLFVNDALVRSLKTPNKGKPVTLPVPDEADAAVRAEVTLKPLKPGRKPKTHEVTVGYIACS